MRLIIFAQPEVANRLRELTSGFEFEIVSDTSDASELIRVARSYPVDILLLDPTIDFSAASQAAQDCRELHGCALAFLAPSDDIMREVLLSFEPAGILPMEFGRGDITALLEAAQAQKERQSVVNSPASAPPTSLSAEVAATCFGVIR